jgi:hypothetical protein
MDFKLTIINISKFTPRIIKIIFTYFFTKLVPVSVGLSLPRGKVYSVGSEISIYCNASGFPAPEVLWYKDNRAVEPSEHIRVLGIDI